MHARPRGRRRAPAAAAGRPSAAADDVVAERLAEAAGQQEVALHVDDDQRGLARAAAGTGRLGVDGRVGRVRGSTSCLQSCGMGRRDGVGHERSTDRSGSARFVEDPRGELRARCRRPAPGRAPSRWPAGRRRSCPAGTATAQQVEQVAEVRVVAERGVGGDRVGEHLVDGERGADGRHARARPSRAHSRPTTALSSASRCWAREHVDRGVPRAAAR